MEIWLSSRKSGRKEERFGLLVNSGAYPTL